MLQVIVHCNTVINNSFITDIINNDILFTKGAPNKGYLEQSITSNDNPFLRANVQAIKAHQMRKEGKGKARKVLFV